MRHRHWRSSQIRVFTLAENVSEERAKAAGEVLSRTEGTEALTSWHQSWKVANRS